MRAMSGSVVERERDAAQGGTDRLTVGVEEEFLLVDPHTGTAVPAVDLVMEQVPAELRGQVQREFQTSQIEIGSPPGLELSSIRHSLGVLRRALAGAAERAGVRVLAIGTGPVDGPVPPVVDKPRFDRMIERFRLLVPGPGNNGMSVAPTPYLESREHYERLIRQLIASGVMLDEGMLYWYARLSAKYPTVELRIGDVCPSVDDAVLIAALLVERLAPALERHGDLAEVTDRLGGLRRHGTGAARQRAVFARTGSLVDVVRDVARQTRG
ncbi:MULTISPECIES: glutamate-cysteine ligase family protein [unclassified Micromonospora]|uniref:carboxylate-amine ligase n=1 Tax=unclassified Micromonospora TaxID=2617518 RepID=UPI003625D62B